MGETYTLHIWIQAVIDDLFVLHALLVREPLGFGELGGELGKVLDAWLDRLVVQGSHLEWSIVAASCTMTASEHSGRDVG